MKLKPQGRFEGTMIGRLLKTRLAVIASNWVFQGMRYMNMYEISLKLLIDIVFTVLLYHLLSFYLNVASSLIVSVLVAHTLNWVFNGHIFVLMRYVAPVPKTEQDFEDFIQKMKDISLKWSSVDGVAIYGSYCRGALHKFSDLDVRVITQPGMINSISGAVFCLYLRLIAFFDVFPLDIYACDKMMLLDRMRDDEWPYILIDHSGRLSDRYAERGAAGVR
ncbi:MAG TPA: nucleotidyltransferase domain-containing protein [Gammaproteobacteria bacterium]